MQQGGGAMGARKACGVQVPSRSGHWSSMGRTMSVRKRSSCWGLEPLVGILMRTTASGPRLACPFSLLCQIRTEHG